MPTPPAPADDEFVCDNCGETFPSTLPTVVQEVVPSGGGATRTLRFHNGDCWSAWEQRGITGETV